MRSCAPSGPELLLLQRTVAMAFAPGAIVFPGGRVDTQDRELASHFPQPDAPERIAAIRETIEETGICPALQPVPEERASQRLRDELTRGRSFSEALDAFGLQMNLDALLAFSRWCPNFRETRRFDTMFYLAEAPNCSHPPTPQPSEAVRTFWSSAADILRQIDEGEAHAIFPTRRNLERLERFASIDEARADAAQHPVTKITPWIEEREGRKWLCIPEGIGYPVTAELLETARRS